MTKLSICIEVLGCDCSERITYIRERLFRLATKLMSSDVTVKAYYDSITLEAEYDNEGAWTRYPSRYNKTLYDVPEEDKAVALQTLKELRDKNVEEWHGYLSADITASGEYDIDFGFTSDYRCINDYLTMEYAELYSENGCPHLSFEEYSSGWDEEDDDEED